MNRFSDAVAVISIEDLMDICNKDSHGGFKTFVFCAGLVGIGLYVRSLMKRVDILEEKCRELERVNTSEAEDDLYDFDEEL